MLGDVFNGTWTSSMPRGNQTEWEIASFLGVTVPGLVAATADFIP